jgi:hypothetical protein
MVELLLSSVLLGLPAFTTLSVGEDQTLKNLLLL